jgi:hypothetical protein
MLNLTIFARNVDASEYSRQETETIDYLKHISSNFPRIYHIDRHGNQMVMHMWDDHLFFLYAIFMNSLWLSR